MSRWIATAALAAAALLVAPAALAAEKVTLEHDDLTLVGHMKEGMGASPSDGVVLMLHGTLAHGRMEVMAGVQDLLAEHGLNSLSINLSYGIDAREGMFECDAPVRHGVADHLQEVSLWHEWLQDEGYGPVTLFGHSRGANQVARYLTEHDPDGIRALVLVAASTFDEDEAAADFEEQSGLPLQVMLDRARELQRMNQEETLMEDVRFLYCEELDVTPRAFLGYYEPTRQNDTPSVIRGMQIPTLVIVGSEDDVVPDLPQKVEAVKDSGDITLMTVDGADHFFRDFFADDVADFTADFIDQN
ncbi:MULTISPECIES: alpha/beta hydrolase [unclassified Thioalkalivibrio]|uniref:alpha/beta hydrolase n=1 Tax=unclassified Thioalkalivibrio TaxID=2621013 RepID=UPI000375D191|nr:MULTISPECIES: alpha/beta hydrolase [unclassified Thioalkalivibrio]